MRITDSTVSMSSAHKSMQLAQARTVRDRRAGDPGEQSLGFYQNYLNQPLKQLNSVAGSRLNNADAIRSIRMQLLHRIFDFLRGMHSCGTSDIYDVSSGAAASDGSGGPGGVSPGSIWVRTASNSFIYHEEETTSFVSSGLVRCADGREIDFGVEMSMTRSFTQMYQDFTVQDYFVTDPLVINIDSDITSVSDFKFLFDLDCDGREESVSFAGAGSGFLALDINDDGIINNGSELFGTRSGNGFADLAGYDSDGDGWIDEDDDIFNRLKVWTKDENGKDKLLNLKEADVGAIFLGNVNTQFSLNNAFNRTDAYIRSTGVFLRESGMVGTLAQVDLTS
ncbi:MAG: hypothetical protein J5509_09445 [Lachnospiraceae bacterium]|nr:hypothetical protein [Lachnospiraceae bacterium]